MHYNYAFGKLGESYTTWRKDPIKRTNVAPTRSMSARKKDYPGLLKILTEPATRAVAMADVSAAVHRCVRPKKKGRKKARQ